MSAYVDFDVGRQRLDSQCEASDQTTSADRHQNGIDIGHLVDYLETTRALPGQNVRVIVTAANILTTSVNHFIIVIE